MRMDKVLEMLDAWIADDDEFRALQDPYDRGYREGYDAGYEEGYHDRDIQIEIADEALAI